MSDAGKQTFGLGRPLRDLLPVEGDRASTPRALFGVTEGRDETSTDALDAALSFAAAALPDDLWGFTAWRPEGGLVTRIAGAAEAADAWVLADALRAAVVDQLPATVRDETSICLAVPAGPGAAIGLRRRQRPLDAREMLFVQAVGAACVLAAGDGPPRRR